MIFNQCAGLRVDNTDPTRIQQDRFAPIPDAMVPGARAAIAPGGRSRTRLDKDVLARIRAEGSARGSVRSDL